MPKISCDVHLTVTLRPVMYRLSSTEQLSRSIGPLLDLLRDLNCIKKTIVFELTKSHNVHYHIICNFDIHGVRNIYNKIYNKFRCSKIFGYVLTDQIKDYNSFVSYILKDVEETYNILGIYPVQIDDYELLCKFKFFKDIAEKKIIKSESV